MRRSLLTVAAAAGLTAVSIGALHAQGGSQPGAINLSAIEGGNYTADAGHSMIGFSVSHLGFNDYFGLFGDVTGNLALDTNDLSRSALEVWIPVATVTVPSAGLKDHLLRPGQNGAAPDFFGPQPVPARFVSTNIELTGATTANVTGQLTLNGITQPITIAAELVGMGTNGMNQKQTLGFHGTTSIQRSAFNIPFGIPFGISDEVDFTISVAFEK